MTDYKVRCADCGQVVELLKESEETRQEGHDGIWADCPDCGVTGYDAIVGGGLNE